ncbi:hypothetical protein C1646_713110 [Rhizophagus diaphanus]|nr:hypothetical protein C1646_732091 [Rhizophagus diaphanus] [Rhizophagus sp. MUCL 43196]RGB29643.1 hypothetical protein C1646_713110 [Rhizophagus diaphanus] [Rhizophagus sp. MUCL 43196]
MNYLHTLQVVFAYFILITVRKKLILSSISENIFYFLCIDYAIMSFTNIFSVMSIDEMNNSGKRIVKCLFDKMPIRRNNPFSEMASVNVP